MDAHIDDESAAVGGIGVVERRTRGVAPDALICDWLADPTCLDRFECAAVARIEAAHEPDLQQDPGALDGVDDGTRVGQRQGQGFFAEDRLEQAGPRRCDQHLGVSAGRRGDDQRVDFFQGEDCFGAVEHAAEAELRLDRRARPRIGISHGVQLDLGRESGQGLRVEAAHSAKADHRDSGHCATFTGVHGTAALSCAALKTPVVQGAVGSCSCS